MKYLKKIIKEEIEKALYESNYDEPQADVFEKGSVSTDDIIYNEERGRVFATNNLQVDINNLNKYNFSKYSPTSINQESWYFDFPTVIGNKLMIDIIRLVRGGKSFWSMTFSIQERGFNNSPELKKLVEDVEGYDNFIQAVNLRMAKDIDPSKY
jgi:hypothetical protein